MWMRTRPSVTVITGVLEGLRGKFGPWTTTRELGAYCLMYQCVVLSYYTRSMSLRSEAAAAHLTLILTSDILGNYMEALLLNDIFMCRLLHIRFRLYIYTVA